MTGTPPLSAAQGLDGPIIGVLTSPGALFDAEALRLKSLGWTPQGIAGHFGVTERAVMEALKRALANVITLDSAEQRLIEYATLNMLEERFQRELVRHHARIDHGKIIYDRQGAEVEDVGVMMDLGKLIVKIGIERRKLLGTDAPARAEIFTIQSLEAEVAKLEALEAELASNDAPRAIESGS